MALSARGSSKAGRHTAPPSIARASRPSLLTGVIRILNFGAERMLSYSAAEAVYNVTPADISDSERVIVWVNASRQPGSGERRNEWVSSAEEGLDGAPFLKPTE